MAVYARGHAGQWWAEVMGEKFPCIGAMRVKGDHFSQVYHIENSKSTYLIDAIEDCERVVLREEILQSNGIYKVIGYVGLYWVKMETFKVTNHLDGIHRTIEFDLGQKIVSIKNK